MPFSWAAPGFQGPASSTGSLFDSSNSSSSSPFLALATSASQAELIGPHALKAIANGFDPMHRNLIDSAHSRRLTGCPPPRSGPVGGAAAASAKRSRPRTAPSSSCDATLYSSQSAAALYLHHSHSHAKGAKGPEAGGAAAGRSAVGGQAPSRDAAETTVSPFSRWVLAEPPPSLGQRLVEHGSKSKSSAPRTAATAILPGWSAVLADDVLPY